MSLILTKELPKVVFNAGFIAPSHQVNQPKWQVKLRRQQAADHPVAQQFVVLQAIAVGL